MTDPGAFYVRRVVRGMRPAGQASTAASRPLRTRALPSILFGLSVPEMDMKCRCGPERQDRLRENLGVGRANNLSGARQIFIQPRADFLNSTSRADVKRWQLWTHLDSNSIQPRGKVMH